jgi:hypothetical protein
MSGQTIHNWQCEKCGKWHVGLVVCGCKGNRAEVVFYSGEKSPGGIFQFDYLGNDIMTLERKAPLLNKPVPFRDNAFLLSVTRLTPEQVAYLEETKRLPMDIKGRPGSYCLDCALNQEKGNGGA